LLHVWELHDHDPLTLWSVAFGHRRFGAPDDAAATVAGDGRSSEVAIALSLGLIEDFNFRADVCRHKLAMVALAGPDRPSSPPRRQDPAKEPPAAQTAVRH
jgi:hypothetical protein